MGASGPRLPELVPILAALTILAAGCRGGESVPGTLADGSPARTAGVRLEGVDGPVLRTRRLRTDVAGARASPRTAACLRSRWSGRPASPVVWRVAASGESVTFPGQSGRALQACDGAGDRAASKAWCGHAFGRTVSGRLRDPRLDVGGCRTSEGDAIAFAWIEPMPGARYIVVHRSGFSESYEIGDGLPIRVAVTERVDVGRTRATFVVSEHTATGRLLRERKLEAVVSG